MAHLIVLADVDDECRFFDPDSLNVQLTAAGIVTGGETAKSAARHFAKMVKKMRDAQRFAGRDAKDLEKQVDAMIAQFLQTIEKL